MTTQTTNQDTCSKMLLEIKIQCCSDPDTKCPAAQEKQKIHSGGDAHQQTPPYYHREIF